MLESGGPAVRINIASIVSDFVEKRLERCPVDGEPTTRPSIARALCDFAARDPYYCRASRDTMLQGLERALERTDVPVSLPCRRTFRTYLLRTQEKRQVRMVRLKQ